MSAHKVHYLRPVPSPYTEQRTTHCGLTGWFSNSSDTELETVQGTRFEVANRLKGATCQKCIAALAEKIG